MSSYLFNVRGRTFYHIGTGSCFMGHFSLSRIFHTLSKRAVGHSRSSIGRLLADTTVRQLCSKTETAPHEQGSSTNRQSDRGDLREVSDERGKTSVDSVNHCAFSLHFFPTTIRCREVGSPSDTLVDNTRNQAPQERHEKKLHPEVNPAPHHFVHFGCHTLLHSVP